MRAFSPRCGENDRWRSGEPDFPIRHAEQEVAAQLFPRRESLVPFVHVPRHAWTPSPWNVHTETRNSVPFRIISAYEYIFGSGDFPHSANCEKPAGDFSSVNAPAILDFFQMIV